MTRWDRYLLFLPILLLLGGVWKENSIESSKPVTLRFGIYFNSTTKASKSALEESLKQWVHGIIQNTKIDWLKEAKIERTIYDTRSKLYADIDKDKIDFMNISSLDYFNLALGAKVVPLLAPAKSTTNKFEKYLIISSEKSSIKELSSISNSEIVLPVSNSLNLMKVWLKTFIHDKIQSKMCRIKESPKSESEALLAVFFGKENLAVVRESTFAFATELNPQLKTKIRILAHSPNLINNFFVHRISLDAEIYQAILFEGVNLNKSIDGRQLLNLAQTDCINPLSSIDLKETGILINRYNAISKQSPIMKTLNANNEDNAAL